MGIRFYCPQGHKLNVKVEQAGKVGICPKCGARVQIPLESTRSSSHKKQDPTEAVVEQDESRIPVDQNETFPSAPFSAEDSSEEYISEDKDVASFEMAPPVIEKSSPFTKNVPVPDQWEVLIGNQTYGPVSRDQFLQWIDEQRISATMQVRRVDWNEWKVVREIPEFAVCFTPSEPPVSSAPKQIFPQETKKEEGEKASSAPFQLDPDAVFESEQKRKTQAKKRKKRNRDIGLVVGLLAAIIGLLALLLFLLAR